MKLVDIRQHRREGPFTLKEIITKVEAGGIDKKAAIFWTRECKPMTWQEVKAGKWKWAGAAARRTTNGNKPRRRGCFPHMKHALGFGKREQAERKENRLTEVQVRRKVGREARKKFSLLPAIAKRRASAAVQAAAAAALQKTRRSTPGGRRKRRRKPEPVCIAVRSPPQPQQLA